MVISFTTTDNSDSISPSPDIDDAASASQFLSDNTSNVGNLGGRFFNVKQHPVNLHDLEKSIYEGSQHSRGDFSYNVRP